jgi:hypothetical protein
MILNNRLGSETSHCLAVPSHIYRSVNSHKLLGTPLNLNSRGSSLVRHALDPSLAICKKGELPYFVPNVFTILSLYHHVLFSKVYHFIYFIKTTINQQLISIGGGVSLLSSYLMGIGDIVSANYNLPSNKRVHLRATRCCPKNPDTI